MSDAPHPQVLIAGGVDPGQLVAHLGVTFSPLAAG